MSNSPAPTEVMGIGNMLNNKGGVKSAQGSNVDLHAIPQLPQISAERADSPHGSEHSRYSAPLNGLVAVTSYQSPSALQAAPMQISAGGIGQMTSVLTGLSPAVSRLQRLDEAPEGSQPSSKVYPCSTCGKGFARRSDLARHERIHSGVRPHVCDFPGCGKQFIQRSALTVHQRTHTGEKPHKCERCSKPFSDSSSLARHRRIHSGTRPYRCPYADCQKTFTRRTTLTRHQNHHTGTIEEAARATAEALALGAIAGAAAHARSTRLGGSESEQVSNQGSPLTTPSPGQRTMSMSPSAEIAAMNNMQAYVNNSSLPVHLRSDAHVGSPNSTASSGYTTANMRPTSHPTGYGPPPTLEPNIEHQQGPGSASGSPHLASVGWQSPSHVASPTHSSNGNGYVYPDPEGYPSSSAMGQIFYNNANNMRRPGSTDPSSGSYDVKPRSGELWAAAQ